ncbi:uncharacterized protein F5891DRAFT_1189725 [Suillus fuscotomentosus]|uniref:Uncharacterized protein n=1 Tax=Suillus fuscotomentosus TaxID=1912939 RepID=A0AAD4E5C3_9AGAM|nr:uncharacterized protein F5891DRAFT_1189725 [Suillus fuscotomentosus]KAG1899566.1 hypothetical protein F5891DRAFT_1189725 [Suillus fuscotomentosus]
MSGDKWSKDIIAFFNNSIFSTSNSTTINDDITQGHLTDMWEEDFECAFEDGVEGPVFHASAPPALSLHPNEPLPSVDNTETSPTIAPQIGLSASISTVMQHLVLASDTQDQVVSEHDTNTDTIIVDTTVKPKPKPRPKAKHGKGKAGLDDDFELTEANTRKSSRKRS